MIAMVWLVLGWLVWLRLAGRSGRPRVRDGVVMLIFGGCPKTFVRRTSAV